jgi:hypothetical protein
MYRLRPDYEMRARPINEYPENLNRPKPYAHDSKQLGLRRGTTSA